MRLFVAIDPPASVREALARHTRAFTGDVRPVPDDQLHLTLRFLGEVDEARVPAIVRALDEAVPGPPIALEVRGGGAFPSARRPKVLWAGLSGDLEPLAALALRIDRAVTALGLPPADHPFRPHLTLARVRRGFPRADVATVQALPDLGRWEVREVHLVKSTLGQRVVHERIGSFGIERFSSPK